MPNAADLEVQDLITWHQVTDDYAAALNALQRGEPAARARVQDLYVKLRRVMTPVKMEPVSDHR